MKTCVRWMRKSRPLTERRLILHSESGRGRTCQEWRTQTFEVLCPDGRGSDRKQNERLVSRTTLLPTKSRRKVVDMIRPKERRPSSKQLKAAATASERRRVDGRGKLIRLSIITHVRTHGRHTLERTRAKVTTRSLKFTSRLSRVSFLLLKRISCLTRVSLYSERGLGSARRTSVRFKCLQ